MNLLPVKNQGKLLLILILLLALALRLWLWSRPAHPPANDETEYLAVAADLAHGRGFVFYDSYRWLRAPLYPLFLAFFLWVSGDNVRVVTMAQVVLSTATVYGLYLLTRRLFPGERGERAGRVGALLAALLLPFATFPALFMAETLFTFLLVASFLALLQIPPARPARRWAWALAAGALLGLGALTRAVALAFLPVAAGWLAGTTRRPTAAPSAPALDALPSDDAEPSGAACSRRLSGLRALFLPALLVAAGLAAIAPWTIHNAVVYRRFIPLDTGAAYSLWAFYDGEPHEIEEVNAQLEAIPNPADRQAYAIGKGLEQLRRDPAILWRKALRAFPYLLRLKPIEDRFLKVPYVEKPYDLRPYLEHGEPIAEPFRGIPYREPSLAYFSLALLFDDGLYVLITIASLFAFLFLPAGRGKTLALLWLLYNVAVTMALHAEARYRQLLFPAMIPYAALALAHGRKVLAQAKEGRWWRGALLTMLLVGWGYCFVTYSPWDWIRVNLVRGFHQTAGRVNESLGRPEAAVESYRRAAAADPRHPEPYLDLGLALERWGRREEAIQAYGRCWSVRLDYFPCSAALGNLLRQAGQVEEAREAFRGRWVDEADVVAWAWERLAPAPLSRLDIGNGLDYGYVNGVHASETAGGTTYRWTTAQAHFRLSAPVSGDVRLRLRLAGPRPGVAQPVPLEVWENGQLLGRWEVSPSWRVYETPPFQVQEGQRKEVVLKSPTFVPQEEDPVSTDSRSLGVQVDWAEMVTAITGSSPTLWYNSLTPFP